MLDGALVNAMLDAHLLRKDGMFFMVINPVYYDQDGVHVYENGLDKLTNNTRASICRVLIKNLFQQRETIEIVSNVVKIVNLVAVMVCS